MRIDAHQHFWRYTPHDYPWIGAGMQALRRDFMPDEFAGKRIKCAIDGSIVVQARPSTEETRWLLALSDADTSIVGVVGWIDLEAEDLTEQLQEERHPRLCGFRHLIQDEADPAAYMARPSVRRGIRALQCHGMAYDVLITAPYLPSAHALCATCDEHFLILDHLGKPNIRGNGLADWQQNIRQLAEFDHVICKVSGLITEADWQHWHPETLWPYLDTALEAFGESRLMFGSDWPVCRLAGNYTAVYRLIDEWASHRRIDKQALFGGNAQRCYRLSIDASE